MTESSKSGPAKQGLEKTKGHSPAGGLLGFVRKPLEFYRKCALGQSDIAMGRFGTIPICVLSHPRFVEQVLVRDAGNYTQSRLLRQLLRPLLGEGLLIAGEESHQRQRPLVEKAIREGIGPTWGEAVLEAAGKTAAMWAKGEPRDLYPDMLQFVSGVLARVVFGTGQGAVEASTAVERAVEIATTRVREFPPVPAFVPTHDNLEYRRALETMEKVLARAIREKRAVPGIKSRLLSSLVTARGERGEKLSDREIRDQIVMIYVAVQQNLAAALTWTLYLVANNGESYAKVVQEVESLVGINGPTARDVERLSYCEHLVKESLRLYPPVWQMIRQTVSDTQMDGHKIRAGTEVLMSQWVLQRDERFFDKANEFIPERWENPRAGWKSCYFPLGAGPRACLGEALTFVAMKLVIAVFARKLRLKLVSGQEVRPFPGFALRPAGRLLMEAMPQTGNRPQDKYGRREN